MSKRCPKCGTTFADAATNFDRNRAQSDGWSPYCKTCKRGSWTPSAQAKQHSRDRSRMFMRTFRAEHPERERATKHRYYVRHKGEVAVRGRTYRAANIDRVRERARQYHYAHREAANAARRARYVAEDGAAKARARRAANPEHHRALLRAWRRRNPDKAALWDRTKLNRRRGAPGRLTAIEIVAQGARQLWICAYCPTSLVAKPYHVDHVIPLSRGGTNTADNIVIACPPCNMRKHNKLVSEWRRG